MTNETSPATTEATEAPKRPRTRKPSAKELMKQHGITEGIYQGRRVLYIPCDTPRDAVKAVYAALGK